MLMQSNEPFARVDQGVSPMTAGLLSGLAMGGMAAGYQGLGHLSYTGLDAKYENRREKANKKIEKIQSKGSGGLNRLQQMHNSAVFSAGTATMATSSSLVNRANTRVNKAEQAVENFDSKFTDYEREQISRNHTQNKPLTSRHLKGQVKEFDNLLNKSEKAYNNQARIEGVHNNVVSGVNKIQNALSFSGGVNESKIQKQKDKLSKFSSENLAAEKEAHRWHGNNLKKASMKSGAFALGGFVVGGGVQMAVNSLNNS